MHKSFLVFLLLVFSLASCKKSMQRKHFISEYEVAQYLNKKYAPERDESGKIYRLAKKRDGWFVQQVSYNEKTNSYEVLKEEICWSAETNSFSDVQLPQLSGSEPRIPYFKANEYYNTSDRTPYYGYEGWAEDVIADFEGTEEDTTLEGLARAYESYAEGFMTNHFPFTDSKNLKKPVEERLKLFTENIDKAIAIFAKLKQVNPDYEMLVGLPQTKLSNVYVAAWLNLTHAGRTDLGARYMVDDLYDPLMLSFARAALSSCPKNAVLFTFGDNDTYPLYYLQQHEKLRTDVEIVNQSLIQAPDIIAWYQKERKLKMSIDAATYARNGGLVFRIANEIDSIEWPAWVDAVKAEAAKALTGKPGIIPRGPVKVAYPMNNDLLIPDSLLLPIKFGFAASYAMGGDIAIADIVVSNIATRPICTTGDGLSLFGDQFLQRGGHSRLVPLDYAYRFENIHTELPTDVVHFVTFYTTGFKFDTACTDRKGVDSFVENLRREISAVALRLSETDVAKFNTLMNWHDGTFTRNAWPYSVSLNKYVQALLKTGQKDKAKTVTDFIIADTKARIPKEHPVLGKISKNELSSFCFFMMEQATNNAMPDWASKLKKEGIALQAEK